MRISISPDILRNSKSSEHFPKCNTGNNTPHLVLPRLKKGNSELPEDSIFPEWLKKRKDFQIALNNYDDIG